MDALASPALKTLKRFVPPTYYGNVIATLAVSHFYVFSDARVREVSQDLLVVRPLALAVVDHDLRPLGLIVTSRLQEALSRPFAHEVYDRRPIAELMEAARVFSWDKNILTVTERLDSEIQDPKNHFFLLETTPRTFGGIFTTRDLLIHLYQSLNKDMVLARKIQEAVVPKSKGGRIGSLEYRASATMAKGVGGDWYSVLDLGPKGFFSVADVSGKGAAASMVTTLLGGIISLYDFSHGLKPLLAKLNDYVLATFAMEKYLTGFFALWDEASGVFEAYDMGHGYAFVLGPNGLCPVPVDNPFLGFVPGLEPRGLTLALAPGEVLVILTDGFAEQQNVDGVEYGIERVKEFFLARRDLGLEDLDRLFHDDVRRFRGDQPKGDDMTALFLRRT